MVYVIGVAGFAGGFILGLMALQYVLRDRSKRDLLNDRSLRLYGLIVWGMAALGAASAAALWTQFAG